MDFLLDLFHTLRDVRGLVAWGGYVGLTAIIFAETGHLVGFFLPGDSLLVTAGLLSSQPQFGLNVWLLGSILTVAAIVGDAVGFGLGRFTGPRIFTREESWFFKPRYLVQAHEFYERHGGKAVVLARFMPILRTFVPFVAGAARMDYSRFAMFNIVGGVAWIWSMLLTGYYLGRYIPGIGDHLEKIIIIVVLLSISPAFIHWFKARREQRSSPKSP
jgi:membrane-associated protein